MHRETDCYLAVGADENQPRRHQQARRRKRMKRSAAAAGAAAAAAAARKQPLVHHQPPPPEEESDGEVELDHAAAAAAAPSPASPNATKAPAPATAVPPPVPPKKSRRGTAGAAAATASAATSGRAAALPSVENRWQRGRDLVEKLFQPLKCDPTKVTLLPDAETMSALRGACQAWMNTRRQNPQLNFSTRLSFAEQMARFLLQMILQATDELGRDVTGCAVWKQPVDYSADDNVSKPTPVRCYHGEMLIPREHTIEMSVNSEAGKRALSEQPQLAKVVQNEYGRSVVRICHDDALMCMKDAQMPSGQHSQESCGLFFSDAVKLRNSLAQYAAFQKACFPGMPEAGRHLAVVLRCRCNWSASCAPKPVMQLGRQTCRLIPHQLSSAGQLDAESLEDERLKASVYFPCLLVFQCCNPVFRGSRSSGAGQCETQSCDWKLSAPDLLNAVQMAKNMWRDLLSDEPLPPLRIPEMRWHNSLRFQPALLPQQVVGNDADSVEGAVSPFEMSA